MAVHERRRPDRRLDTRQADRARRPRPALPQPPLPQPLRQPEAGRIRYGVLGDDAGTDHRRRHRLPPRRRLLLRHHDLERRRRGREWFAWWLADWDMDVHLTDVSQGLAAFNLAGPRSREILSGLTDLDCSNEAFTYLDGERATWRASPACCFGSASSASSATSSTAPRRSPSTSGTRSWRRASPHGRPFGLEPQRVLRLQKLTSSSARTPTPSRTRSRQRCRGS